MKIIYYKLIKLVINIISLTKVIYNIFIRYSSISKSIISNLELVFTLKFWFLFYFILVLNIISLSLFTYKLITKLEDKIV